jgi:Zn finger protein HypA/HybF involved in hydrogenase expression
MTPLPEGVERVRGVEQQPCKCQGCKQTFPARDDHTPCPYCNSSHTKLLPDAETEKKT